MLAQVGNIEVVQHIVLPALVQGAPVLWVPSRRLPIG